MAGNTRTTAGVPARAVAAGVGLWLVLAPGAFGQTRPEVRIFRLDPKASRLVVVLGREGALSAFAHDHLLVAGELEGVIAFHPRDVTQSTVRLMVPVAALSVDLPAERAREGVAGGPGEADRREITANMLAPGQLNAAAFPEVTAVSQRVAGSLPEIKVWMQVGIRGAVQVIPVAVSVKLEGGGLTAEGVATLRHSGFGIRPFSLFLGAVAVADEVRVRFRLVAREVP